MTEIINLDIILDDVNNFWEKWILNLKELASKADIPLTSSAFSNYLPDINSKYNQIQSDIFNYINGGYREFVEIREFMLDTAKSHAENDALLADYITTIEDELEEIH